MVEIISLIILVIAGIGLFWFLSAVALPFLFLPNFLRKEKIEKTKEIRELAETLISKNKEQTLKNIYHYINVHLKGEGHQYNLLNLFGLHDYKISRLILFKRKKFFWCYIQIKVLKTLLLNTGQFFERDINIRKTLADPFFTLHQYAVINIGKNKRVRVDPFYNIFRYLN